MNNTNQHKRIIKKPKKFEPISYEARQGVTFKLEDLIKRGKLAMVLNGGDIYNIELLFGYISITRSKFHEM